MRLLFYIFLICQIFNFLAVFAEKVKEDSSESNSIKWEKVEEEKSNSIKKIFWKSFKDDESYFQEKNEEDVIRKIDKKFYDKNKLLNLGGLTVDNSLIPKEGESYLNIDLDSSGNLFSSYSYSLSNIFQLNLVNAGSFNIKNNSLRRNSQLTDTYLQNDNLNYRVGGKILFFPREKNDLIWLSSRVSFGRDFESKKDYIYAGLTSTIKLNSWLTFNVSPKYIFGGVENLGAIGLSNNISLSNEFQFIAETNIGNTQNSSNNSTFSLRYAYSPFNSIDVFATNAVGFQDIGTMLSINDYKFGIRINCIF